MDEKGNELEGVCSGYLCIKHSWPSAFRTLYGDHERYETTYFKPFPGYYFTGDGCSRYPLSLCEMICDEISFSLWDYWLN